VVIECEPELPLFPADAHLLKQAIVNLVVNAVQAMPKGGTVTVRSSLLARPEGAWLQVEVRDQGPGLSPRAAEKMFQPFFTTKATGTGLGLAVVKRIVESHQGEIIVPPTPEKGATFTLRIPPASERDSVSPLLAGEATRRGG
jgi:two-component system, NtrC family, sensor histidine kinase HydH